MINIGGYLRSALMILGGIALGSSCAWAQGAQSASPCPRPAAGSIVTEPSNLFSSNGGLSLLSLAFNYLTTTDADGRTLFCFETPSGWQSPTLHVKPGDTLQIAVTNQSPPPPGSPTEIVSSNVCGDATSTITSLNVHYHGTNTSPRCHGDQVIHTIINSGEIFNYSLKFPTDEPPGLYRDPDEIWSQRVLARRQCVSRQPLRCAIAL